MANTHRAPNFLEREQRTPKKGGQQEEKFSFAKAYTQKLEDYALLLEFKTLKAQNNITGVYVMPAFDNLRKWHGVIFCRSGKYRNGVFKFYLDLLHYPNRGPRVVFTSEVFNPLVNPKTGELDMSIQFPTWDKSLHFIALSLAYLKMVFYNASYWDPRARHEPFNKDAAKLWLENKAKFDKKCEECVKKSNDNLYNHDKKDTGLSIKFTKPTHNHSLLLHRILTQEHEPEHGYIQWFEDGVKNLAGVVARTQAPSVQMEEDMIRELQEKPNLSLLSETDEEKALELRVKRVNRSQSSIDANAPEEVDELTADPISLLPRDRLSISFGPQSPPPNRANGSTPHAAEADLSNHDETIDAALDVDFGDATDPNMPVDFEAVLTSLDQDRSPRPSPNARESRSKSAASDNQDESTPEQ